MTARRKSEENGSTNTRFRWAVSFESDSRPVHTIRGEILRDDAEAACKSAVHFAFAQIPRGIYRSWVVCVETVEANPARRVDSDGAA